MSKALTNKNTLNKLPSSLDILTGALAEALNLNFVVLKVQAT